MSEHVLVFGAGYDIPARMRQKSTPHRPIRTTVMCWPSHLKKLEAPAGNERIVVLPESAPLSEWINIAKDIHGRDRVTRIATIYDDCRKEGAAVGLDLGLRSHTPALVELINDKGLMRSKLASHGVERIPFTAVVEPSSPERDSLDPPFPVVVKPLTGEASKGVSVVRDRSSFDSAFERAALASQGGSVIVETYLEGPQFSVEAFSEAGLHRPLALTKKYSEERSLVEVGHVLPAPVSMSDRERIYKHVEAALDALGVIEGPTHTEVVLTEEGPRIIETHLRTGGDELWNMVTDATDIDMLECQMDQILGESILQRIDDLLADGIKRDAQAIWFGIPPESGTLKHITGTEDVGPDVRLELLVRPGQVFTGLQHSDSRVAQARAGAVNAELALAKSREAIAKLRLLTEHLPDTPATL